MPREYEIVVPRDETTSEEAFGASEGADMLTRKERLEGACIAVAGRIRRVAKPGGEDPFLGLGGPFSDLQGILMGAADTAATGGAWDTVESRLLPLERLLPDRMASIRRYVTNLMSPDKSEEEAAQLAVQEAASAINALRLACHLYGEALSGGITGGDEEERWANFEVTVAIAEAYARADLVGT